MTPATALVNVVMTATPLGGMFQACFFLVPFWEFYEQRDLIHHIRIKGARIKLHLSFTDAYFFYLTELMKNYMSWNLYEYMCWISFGGSKKKQNKWLDQHITWRGNVPQGESVSPSLNLLSRSLCTSNSSLRSSARPSPSQA